MNRKSCLLLLSIIVLAGGMSGCSSSGRVSTGSLLDDKYLAGGGYDIKYSAPVSGTVIYADAASKKILMTKTLLPGETFEVNLQMSDEDTLRGIREAGLDPSKLVLRLYFIPRVEQLQQPHQNK
jgi:hypothetical protein